ncbi:hypothetical protein Glove_74g228 [Diversispora epigaea]|uniref:Uncharacterized protein n=1 Tax=Diversispora epigaea TaxID=1348612 RepID=A0A397JJ59_9GLOM|nr:hypothetical protein Glove_74g228 [Diversispora epigaea]
MLKHTRKILPIVKRSARQYYIPIKDNLVTPAPAIKVSDVVHYAAIGASLVVSVFYMINSSIAPFDKKLDRLSEDVSFIKEYFKISETDTKTDPKGMVYKK